MEPKIIVLDETRGSPSAVLSKGACQWLQAQAEMIEAETGLPTTTAEMVVALVELEFNKATTEVEVGDVWTDIPSLEEEMERYA